MKNPNTKFAVFDFLPSAETPTETLVMYLPKIAIIGAVLILVLGGGVVYFATR